MRDRPAVLVDKMSPLKVSGTEPAIRPMKVTFASVPDPPTGEPGRHLVAANLHIPALQAAIPARRNDGVVVMSKKRIHKGRRRR